MFECYVKFAQFCICSIIYEWIWIEHSNGERIVQRLGLELQYISEAECYFGTHNVGIVWLQTNP